jgi:hypothetical protein
MARRISRKSTFVASLDASKKRDALALFNKARAWNRIAHMKDVGGRLRAYASKSEALTAAVRIDPTGFQIAGVEDGGWLVRVLHDGSGRSLHISRVTLEGACGDWWVQQVKRLINQPEGGADDAALAEIAA